MVKEKVVYYKCPFCGKGDIYSYRVWEKEKGAACSKYEYWGACCPYYPHENKKVENALKRLTPERQDIPVRCTTFAEEESRQKKLQQDDC